MPYPRLEPLSHLGCDFIEGVKLAESVPHHAARLATVTPKRLSIVEQLKRVLEPQQLRQGASFPVGVGRFGSNGCQRRQPSSGLRLRHACNHDSPPRGESRQRTFEMALARDEGRALEHLAVHLCLATESPQTIAV